MDADRLFDRYRELQSYVGWTDEDARRIAAVAPLLDPHLPALIDDFYAEIERHPEARKVITGGQPQIDRLKGTLLRLAPRAARRPLRRDVRRPPLAGRLAARRDRPRPGLHQRRPLPAPDGPGAAPSRRAGRAILRELQATARSLNTLLDLDLAIIEDAYQAEYAARLQRAERLATHRPGGRRRSPTSCATRSTSSRPRSTTCSTPATRRPRRRPSTCSGSSGTWTLADGVITALSNFAKMPVPSLRPTPVEPCVREALEA